MVVLPKGLFNLFVDPGPIPDPAYEAIKTALIRILKKELFKMYEMKDPRGKTMDKIDDILPELHFVNKFKLETEIETGILFCDECKRWFPIIETIPQMLPDQYRDKKKELDFLKTNKDLLDKEFIDQELKPFNI